MLTTSPSMASRSLRHPDLVGLPPAIRHRGRDGNHVFRYQYLCRDNSLLFGKSIDGKCSDLGVSAPYGRNIAPMRVYHRRGRLIGESQKRVARAIRLRRMPGDVGVSPTTKIPLLLARVRLITLCEVRNTAGPSHHDLVNGSLLMKSTKYEGRNCAYRCPLDL